MALFPEARRVVEAPDDGPPVWSPEHDIAAERAAAREEAAREPREDVAEVRDVDADGVPCRLYRPVDALPGVVVHLHGGGFVFHDVEVHDASARRLANRSRRTVLSVDYRRPPEHRFPAAPDDVSAVVRWLQQHEQGPYSVHGDSAGGNLALVAALRHPGVFAAAALVYPFLVPTVVPAAADSVEPGAGEGDGNGFDGREAAWYWEQYAASPADLEHPDLAPLRSDRLGTMPPTLVVTAEHDPLRDEGEELALRLAEEGVAVVSTRYQGQIHGFWRHPTVYPAAEPLMRQVAGFLDLHA